MGQYVLETLKSFLIENNHIRKDWNALNILNQRASGVGALDLDFYSINEKDNFPFFDKMDNDYFKFVYLLGADDFTFDKKDMFSLFTKLANENNERKIIVK